MNNGRIVHISAILLEFLISINLYANLSNREIDQNFGGFRRSIDNSCSATCYSATFSFNFLFTILGDFGENLTLVAN